MAPIPDFIDDYYLPGTEHICTMNDIECRFVHTPQRKYLWDKFKKLIKCLEGFSLIPSVILIDGSFVTGRSEPHDIDICVLLDPDRVEQVLQEIDSEEDQLLLVKLFNKEYQDVVLELFGVQVFVAHDDSVLEFWSDFFRNGLDGELEDPDPERDPKWVKKPLSKGILKVCLSNN